MAETPYCGVYCVYAGMRALGLRPQMQNLVVPRFIGSDEGSSLSELADALTSNGVRTAPFMNLDVDDLRTTNSPVILHVRSETAIGADYNHFVLYLGKEGDDALILNPPYELLRVPYRAIVAQCDGSGLIMSKSPIILTVFSSDAWRRYCRNILAVTIFVLALKYVITASTISRALPPVGQFVSCALQLLFLLLLGTTVGLAYNFMSPEGLLGDSGDVSLLGSSNARQFTPHIDIHEFDMRRKSGALIIDARLPADYDAGHVPGALNIPITSDNDYRLTKLKSFNGSQEILIYCQSLACPFSDKLTFWLQAKGFSRIYVYSGGWADWSTVHHEVEKSQLSSSISIPGA